MPITTLSPVLSNSNENPARQLFVGPTIRFPFFVHDTPEDCHISTFPVNGVPIPPYRGKPTAIVRPSLDSETSVPAPSPKPSCAIPPNTSAFSTHAEDSYLYTSTLPLPLLKPGAPTASRGTPLSTLALLFKETDVPKAAEASEAPKFKDSPYSIQSSLYHLYTLTSPPVKLRFPPPPAYG